MTAKGAVFVLWSGRNRLSLLLIRKANSTTHAPEWFVLKIMTCELFLCSTAEVKSMVYVKHSALYFTCIFGYRYEELCIFLVEQVPSLQENNKINVSDGLFLPDDKIALYFPASSHLDDAYHMVNINCVKHCPVNEALATKPLVTNFNFMSAWTVYRQSAPPSTPGIQMQTSYSNVVGSFFNIHIINILKILV